MARRTCNRYVWEFNGQHAKIKGENYVHDSRADNLNCWLVMKELEFNLKTHYKLSSSFSWNESYLKIVKLARWISSMNARHCSKIITRSNYQRQKMKYERAKLKMDRNYGVPFGQFRLTTTHDDMMGKNAMVWWYNRAISIAISTLDHLVFTFDHRYNALHYRTMVVWTSYAFL